MRDMFMFFASRPDDVPDFVTLDGGEGGTGAAPMPLIDLVGMSIREALPMVANLSERVLMKLIVSQATRKVLGCHIVAPGAGEMIQLAGVAVKMGATKEDFDRTVAVHPTMSEEIVTMKSPVRTG